MVESCPHVPTPNLPIPQEIRNAYAAKFTPSNSTMSRSSSSSSLDVGNSPDIKYTLDQFYPPNVDEKILNFFTPFYKGHQPYSAITDTLAQFSPKDTSTRALNTGGDLLLIPRERVQASNLVESSGG